MLLCNIYTLVYQKVSEMCVLNTEGILKHGS